MVDRNLIGEFLDAAVLDHTRAEQLLADYPELCDARWLHGETAIHFLAIEGYTEAVQFLGGLGFDVNAPNDFGDPPLIDVATLGNSEIATILLAHGADPNARSLTQDNVLHQAIRSGNADLVDLLLRAGARADYVTDIGETPFDALPDAAAQREAIEAVFRQYGIRQSRSADQP